MANKRRKSSAAETDDNSPKKCKQDTTEDSTQDAILKIQDDESDISDSSVIEGITSNNLINLSHTEEVLDASPEISEDGDEGEDGELPNTQRGDEQEDGELPQTPCSNTAVPNTIPIYVPSEMLNNILDAVLNVKDQLQTLQSSHDTLTSEIKKLKRSNNVLKKQIGTQSTVIDEVKSDLKGLKSKNLKLTKLIARKHMIKPSDKNDQDRQEKPISNPNQKATNNKVRPMDVNTPANQIPSTASRESLSELKHRVVPRWRQLYYKRRDEYKRGYRNHCKASTLEHYKNINFLPRKFRPKHARTLEEFKVKEEAAFKALEAEQKVCIIDSKQAEWNFALYDSEAKRTIEQNSSKTEEKDTLLRVWFKEAEGAEPKARAMCQREINFQKRLPETDPYLGFDGLRNSEVRPQIQQTNADSGYGPDNGLYTRRSNNGRPGRGSGSHNWRQSYNYNHQNTNYSHSPNFQNTLDQASLY